MTKCPYRADKECKKPSHQQHTYADQCHFCLIAQQIDEISLLNSAIGNLTASIEERLIRDR